MDDKQGITVLFADIAGSTRIYELIGDQLAEQLISTTLEQLSSIIVKNNGDIIKSIGDELMCRFPCADDAITAAKTMHEFLANKPAPSRDYKLAIRVGAHHGQVIESHGDIFGDSVNIAARVTALARAGKTLITEYTYNQLSEIHKKYCRHFLQTTVKGKEQPIDVYDVTWEKTDELTRIVEHSTTNPSGNTLTLRYGDNIVKLSSTSMPSAKLGRGASCDLVILSPQASREHCSIEYNRGKFIFTDHSANGSYIRHNQTELFFHQERIPLLGQGQISLGEPSNNNSEFLLEYSIDSD